MVIIGQLNKNGIGGLVLEDIRFYSEAHRKIALQINGVLFFGGVKNSSYFI